MRVTITRSVAPNESLVAVIELDSTDLAAAFGPGDPDDIYFSLMHAPATETFKLSEQALLLSQALALAEANTTTAIVGVAGTPEPKES